jgi:hypothetical protein
VNNDAANAGVTWSVSCGSAGACGTFNPTATASGSATTYTAPTAIPTGGTVTVTATSVTETTQSAQATITIAAAAPIAVSFGPRPGSLQVSSGMGITAFVANDPANAGVTWTVTCGSASACGAFSAAVTASGVATDFSAPAAIPTGNTVTITVTSVTDITKTATASITITTANTMLADGTYVFSLAGTNLNDSSPFYVGGAFVLSGGAITSGEQDFIDLATIAEDAITGGSITTTADGNLQIVLITADTLIGVNGVETLDAALISGTRARVMEFDSSATSSGRLDQQSTQTAPSAGYAFFVNGFDGSASPAPLAIGGVINIDGAGTISGTGSVFDINDAGAVEQAQSFSASTVSSPDGFGRIVFSLNPSPTSTIPAINLVGYIVDPTHIRLVETSDPLNGTVGGLAIGQGTNTGTFNSIAGNSYVAGLTGFDTSTVGVLQVAGVITANADSSVSGAINYNDLSGSGPVTPSPLTGGTYTVDPTGRVTMTGVTDGIASYTLQLYLSGQGQEGQLAAVTMDANDVTGGVGWQQTGSGSFAASSIFGTYSLYATGWDVSNVNELDAIGPVTADGVGSLTGAFAANTNGAFSGTTTGLDVTTSTNQDAFSYYVVDSTKIFFIETDSNQLTFGFFALEQ